MDFCQRLTNEDNTNLSYEDATPLLHFLDKYATELIGYHELALFYKINRDNTLLDKWTTSDIAYSTLLYKNSTLVWKEDAKIRIKNPSARLSERLKIQRHKVANHKKKGTQIGFGCDGWIEEGKQYVLQIKTEVDALKKDECFWDSITKHWKVYCEKHMIVNYVDSVDKVIEEGNERDTTMDGQIGLPDDPVDFNDDPVDKSGDDGVGSD
jgi:hypothetical protein